jgi:glyoxylase-like metal-dependent hydrolase (beta-lactamase superfamily II)
MEEILPRLYRIVVPLPGNPLKEINSYVFTSNDRNLILDTGMNRPECREVLFGGLDELGLDLDRTDFVVTHLHADHQGLVSSLMRDGSKAYMGEADASPMRAGPGKDFRGSPMGDYAGRSGLPLEDLKASLTNHPGAKYGPGAFVDYVFLNGGETFKVGDYTLEVVSTPGHTRGHMCLYERKLKLFFSGDHVLGDITPNIQAWSDEDDPLNDYINSLKRVDELEVERCLPGHRSIIEDFSGRIAGLIEHHRIRANEVISILQGETLNAYETASRMSWDIVAKSWEDFPLMQKWFATGEAIAHLRYLEEKGVIEREERDGVIYYTTDGDTYL